MEGLSVRSAKDVQDQDKNIAKLVAYRNGKTGGLRLPKRSEIRPTDIKEMIADICIMEPVYGQKGEIEDVIVRLIGTNATSFYGEFTNRSVMEISSYRDDPGIRVTVRRVYVPLSEDNKLVDRVMVYLRVDKKLSFAQA